MQGEFQALDFRKVALFNGRYEKYKVEGLRFNCPLKP
jgi:hypothetical protein